MTEPSLSFLERFVFAWRCLFRIWFDGAFAARLSTALSQSPMLSGASPEGELAEASSEASRADSMRPEPRAPESPAAPAQNKQAIDPAEQREAARLGALQLLGLLQREGRFVDFVQQDIAKFSDADIGAAARVVHAGCRKALASHAVIETARPENEGSRLTLQADFDRTRLKLTGNVGGKPPYQGVLRHRGWFVRDLSLPILVDGYDARVVAAAEVEL